MFGKLAPRALSGLLALALGTTMCPAASLAYAAEGEGQQSTSNSTSYASGNADRISQDVQLDASAGSSGTGESTDPSDGSQHAGGSADADQLGSSEEAGRDEGTGADVASSSSDASSRYTGASNGQTSADVSLAGDATVGTIEYNGLAYTINEGDNSTVSVTGLASTKPAGDVQIPAQITSGGKMYAVTAIKVAGLAEDANPYAEDLFEDSAKALAVKSVSIPQSVTSIDPAFFQLIPNATDISVSSDNPIYTSYDGALYDADLTELILVPQGRGSLVLPLSLAAVPAYVLSQSDKLSAISFTGGTGNDFLAVQNNCLYTSDLSTLLAAPAGLGASASIASECTTIAEGAFFGNATLDTIVVSGIVEGIASAGDSATGADGQPLMSGSAVDGSTLPAFDSATVENATVVINAAAEADGDEASALIERAKAAWVAYGFTNFKEPAAPGTEIVPEEGSGFAFTLLPDYTLSVRWAGATEPPAAIDIPDYGIIDGVQYTVSTIADNGFSNYTSLITADIPQTVTVIGDSAFELCTSLQTVHFDSVVSIGSKAFANTALLSLVLPTTVQSIGDNAFSNMKETTIVAMGSVSDNSPIALGAAAGLNVYVPYGTEDAWDAGIPTLGNHIYPYGVKLSDEPLELEVGQTANIKDSGYIEAPGNIETSYAYKANPISIDQETGRVEAKAEGSSSVNVTLTIAYQEAVVSRIITSDQKLRHTAYSPNNRANNGDVQIIDTALNISADSMLYSVMPMASDLGTFDVNPMVDDESVGDSKAKGYFTFDVWIDGVLVADDVGDYYTEAFYPIGTSYVVNDIQVLNGNYGYAGWLASMQPLSGTISSFTEVRPKVGTRNRTIDVNPEVDCITVGNTLISGDFTFDVYINGALVADDAGDFYQENVPYGSNYQVTDIKPLREGYAYAGWNRDLLPLEGELRDAYGIVAPRIGAAKLSLDVNAQVDCAFVGNSMTDGYFSFDVYINGNLAADDKGDFYSMTVPYGSHYLITDIKIYKDGYGFAGWDRNYSQLEGYVRDELVEVAPRIGRYGTWIDVNGNLDGAGVSTTRGYGTFDVYIDDVLSNSGGTDQSSDFWGSWPMGSYYRIENINALDGKKYLGSSGGALQGQLSNGEVLEIVLKFGTIDMPGFWLDVNGVIDGASGGAGTENIAIFDVYIDGVLVAGDAYDFYSGSPGTTHPGIVAKGSHYRIDNIRPAAGYKLLRADTPLEGYVTEEIVVTLIFGTVDRDDVSLDVNGMLDGVATNGTTVGLATFDLYFDGVLYAEDATDFYATPTEGTHGVIAYGSHYVINDIKPVEGKKYIGFSLYRDGVLIDKKGADDAIEGDIFNNVMIFLEFGTVNRDDISLDVNGRLDGRVIGAGTEGVATFDIYFDGVLYAEDATDFYATPTEGTYGVIAYGSHYTITDIKPVSGKKYIGWETVLNGSSIGMKYGDTIEGDVLNSMEIRLVFGTIDAPGIGIDVNGLLDGNDAGTTSGYGTFDVYIDGKLIADDVTDFCASGSPGQLNGVIAYGSHYRIDDIKASAGKKYTGSIGDIEGDILDSIGVVLMFGTIDAPGVYLDVNATLDRSIALSHTVDIATFDVYIDGVLILDDVTDFYSSAISGATQGVVAYGSHYLISDIKTADGKVYLDSTGEIEGTIISDTVVDLNFATLVTVSVDMGDPGITTGSATPEQSWIGQTVTIAASIAPGFEFGGWTTENSDISFVDADALTTTITMPAHDVVVKPIAIAKMYTINYAPNTDAGIPSDGAFAAGSNQAGGYNLVTNAEVALPGGYSAAGSNTFRYQGHTLKTEAAWTSAASASDSGISFEAGDVIDLADLIELADPSNVITLYAQWDTNTYQVSFDNGDPAGSVPSPSSETVEVPYDGIVGTDRAVTAVGYKFTGWKSGSGSIYTSENRPNISALFTADDLFPPDGATYVLEAQWHALAYTVSFSAEAGVGAGKNQDNPDDPVSVSFAYADLGTDKAKLAVMGNTLGYVFDGWTTPDGTELFASDLELSDSDFLDLGFSGMTSEDETVSLKAVWSEKDFVITYDKNAAGASYINGSAATSDTVKYTAAIALPDKTEAEIAYDGYDLEGWMAVSAASNTIAASSVCDVAAAIAAASASDRDAIMAASSPNVVVYAKWGQGDTSWTIMYHYQDISDGVFDASGIIGKTGSGTTGDELDIDAVVDGGHSHSGHLYALDAAQGDSGKNVLAGSASSNVWHVYYKLQLSVTYKAGDQGAGDDQVVDNLDWGADMPRPDVANTGDESVIHAAEPLAYEFAYWTETRDSDAHITTEDLPAKIIEDSVYTANWSHIEYGISYRVSDADSGKLNAPSSIAPIYYDDLDSMSLSAALPAVGYSFAGWEDARGKAYAAGERVADRFTDLFPVTDGVVASENRAAVLVAKASANAYTVRFVQHSGPVGDGNPEIADAIVLNADSANSFIAPGDSAVADEHKVWGHSIYGWIAGSVHYVAGSEYALIGTDDGSMRGLLDGMASDIAPAADGKRYIDLYAGWNAVYRVEVPDSHTMLEIDLATGDASQEEGRTVGVYNYSPQAVKLSVHSASTGIHAQNAKEIFFRDEVMDDAGLSAALSKMSFEWAGVSFPLNSTTAAPVLFDTPIAAATSTSVGTDHSGWRSKLSLGFDTSIWNIVRASLAAHHNAGDDISSKPVAIITWQVALADHDGDSSTEMVDVTTASSGIWEFDSSGNGTLIG